MSDLLIIAIQCHRTYNNAKRLFENGEDIPSIFIRQF